LKSQAASASAARRSVL